MKFICTQENLNAGIDLVSRLPSRSVGLPILSNILLEVKGGNLIVSSTNLEIGIKTEIRGKSESEGAFTVDAKVFADYINILPKGNVEIELVKNQLSVTCENFHTKIRGQAADEFPIIPQIEGNGKISIKAIELKRALAQTTFATSFDEMRPEINGVLFKIDKKELLMVATDSYRLAEKKASLEESVDLKEVIIPLKTLQEVERVVSSINESDIVDIYFDENQIMLTSGSIILVSRLIEGNFPNYQQIIPNNFSTKAIVKSDELIQATRAASLFARSGINDVHLSFNASKGVVNIKTTNAQLGEQETSLEGVIKGDTLSITFNYKYLLDGLQALASDDVVLELSSQTTPAVLRSEGDVSFLYLIMPIKQ